jgi:hypothetical protein
MKTKSESCELRLRFLELNAALKKFGKTKCKFHKNRIGVRTPGSDCHHPSMGYGGINRSRDCELENCPRILYGNEGK